MADYKAGKAQAAKFLVGQAVKTLAGKADAAKVKKHLMKELSNQDSAA
jgi:Asp-tRNA(Asn)/Glu-tRNA(Gln) amidotransferase B subunit